MMKKDKTHRILIVDDMTENIEVLVAILKDRYMVAATKEGRKAVEMAKKSRPDLILLDIVMPDMSGYDVCRQLKADPETQDIPVMFVTAMGDASDEAKGFELGAVDYITKPVRPTVVRARVATHLKLRSAMLELKSLYSTALDSNPMTGLPGNNSVANRIKQALEKKEAVCVIYADLDNFKAFNDTYGFAFGDEVLAFTAEVFQEAVNAVNKPGSFIGHIGGDDFVLVVPAHLAGETADGIINRFDRGIRRFYTPEDLRSGCVRSVNRQGQAQSFPLMSVSLAGVDLSHDVYTRYIQVNDACAEAKKMAKKLPGSSFFMDRRSAGPCRPEFIPPFQACEHALSRNSH